MNLYDLIIIGGGPAGLTAGLYASRAKLKSLIIEKKLAGGQIATTEHVENYPGYISGTGQELTEIMQEQAKKFGAELLTANVTSVELTGRDKIITTTQTQFQASTVILATGTSSRRLGVPGEDEFIGRGVSFCATCDGSFYEDLPVMVVGGGDAAVEEAVYLARFVEKVYLVHRRDALRATPAVQEKAFANKKIEFVWDSVVKEIQGDELLERVVVKNVKNGMEKIIAVNGVFVYIGFLPNTAFLEHQVKMSDNGYIITDDCMATSVAGVFAAVKYLEKYL